MIDLMRATMHNYQSVVWSSFFLRDMHVQEDGISFNFQVVWRHKITRRFVSLDDKNGVPIFNISVRCTCVISKNFGSSCGSDTNSRLRYPMCFFQQPKFFFLRIETFCCNLENPLFFSWDLATAVKRVVVTICTSYVAVSRCQLSMMWEQGMNAV